MPNPYPTIFKQYRKVNGIHIFSATISTEKINHVAKVLYAYIASKRRIRKNMRQRNSAMLIFEDEDADENFYDSLNKRQKKRYNHFNRNINFQHLYLDEIVPSYIFDSTVKQFDATLEEVLHLVTDNGYAHTYPKIFGIRGNSKLRRETKKARGNVTGRGRNNYPSGTWFKYTDKTCGGSCMMTEYLYWCVSTRLGFQARRKKLPEVKNEFVTKRYNKKAKKMKKIVRKYFVSRNKFIRKYNKY
jgi:hypothetical protein